MKKGTTIIVIILGVAITLLVLLLLALRNNNRFSWTESYRESSDQPFGTEVITGILGDYFSGKRMDIVKDDIAPKLSVEDGVHKNYIFIGQYPYYTDSVFNLLKNFVFNGNDAFMSLQKLPENLSQQILLGGNSISQPDTMYYLNEMGDSVFYMQDAYAEDPMAFKGFSADKMSLNFSSPEFRRDSAYKFQLIIEEEPAVYTWLYFFPDYLKSIQDAEPLGNLYSSNFCNFIRVPYGKGHFYIHTDPIVFSNYFQIEKNNVEYTSKVLSYLKPGDIIWDEFSKSYDDSGQNNERQAEGPLRFILSQTSLRSAWYCLLGSLLLFILFRTKRTQQSIMVVDKNENKSLEFIQTIGRMYYIRRNHKQLASQKMKLFLHFIGDRYQLNTREADEEFINKLHLKSEVSKEKITEIFNLAKRIDESASVNAGNLLLLHNKIDEFYKNCK